MLAIMLSSWQHVRLVLAEQSVNARDLLRCSWKLAEPLVAAEQVLWPVLAA